MSLLTRRTPSDLLREKSPAFSPALVEAPPSSLLYSIIPSRISDRISRLPSLRGPSRSNSIYKGRSKLNSASTPNLVSSDSDPTSGYSSSTGVRTPPPAYAPGSALVCTNPEADTMSTFSFDAEPTQPPQQQQLWRPSHLPSPSTSSLSALPSQPIESQTGILWKFASQGMNLLSLSVDESTTLDVAPSAPAAGGRPTDPTLSRQLYIHALTYLIRGLPTDLSTEEQLGVRASLPSGIVQPMNLSVAQTQHLHLNSSPEDAAAEPAQPSVLHRLLAGLIVYCFTLFQALLPYLKTFLHSAYTYERTHHVSEKVLTRGLDTVDGLGRAGLDFVGRVAQMGDGKVGQVGGQVVRWWIEGVTGGVCDGVGEGMVILGARKGFAKEETRR